MAIKVGNLINASIQYNSEEEQERRLQSYQENGAVLSSWNHEYASDEDRKKYLQAVRDFDADTRYLQSKGYLDNDSARNNRAYMEYTVRDLNHPPYKSYDQWGQATGDQTYLSGLQSQLSDLQNQLSVAQQKMATTGNMDVYYKELQPLQNEISGVQKKIKNTQINVPDAEYEYYAGRTVEQLKADKAAIEQSEHDKWADIAPEEHIPFIIRPEDTREKLSMIDELIGQKEHEEKYAEYQSRMLDEDFDGSYDPTNEDVFYQMMNGTRDRQDLGEQIYWTEGQFDELTDEERQIYNSIYKNEGRDQAFAYYQFVLRDLNARNRAKDEELMRRIAQEDPAGASALSVLYKMASPQAAIYQIVSAFSDEGIDQNSVYNFSSYAPTAIRNQVSRDLQYNEGETAAWLYQVGMSVADNVAQMAVTGGTQTAILALMSSNVFADSVVQMKDEGKSDFEIISTSTVRALIEYATEKIGLDEVFKVGQSGSFKEMLMNTLRATVAEGGEEVLSDVSNLFYDLADSFLSAKKSDYQKELERYRALGFTDSEAIGMIVTDWMKDTGLDFLSGALSGFVLSGTQASAAIAGGNVQSKAIEFAKQSFDETTNIGLSLDSDSLAYKYADLGKKYENPIMQGIQKLTQFTLNDIQTAKEASQYKTEVMDALRAASYEDLESVFYEKFDGAKSVAQQAATAVAFNEILKEREVEQIIKTNPTIETASEAEIGTLLRLSDPTVRTNSGEIVRLENVRFSNAELRAAYNNAAKLGRTSDANDYISEFRSSNLPASVFDRVWNAAFEVGTKKGYDGSNADRMIEQLRSNSDIAAAIEVYGADVTNSILDIARRDGYDSLTRVTEGMKSMVMEMAKSFDDAPEVVFVDNLTDENGDLVNGEYKDGKIYISTTANDPATSVFCHEFTHYLETKKPDVWQQYKEKVLNKLYENKQTFKAIQERVEKAYGSDVETGISEIVAIASENFLIDSEFVDSLKENRGLFSRIRNSVMNRYNQIRTDVVRESVMFMTMEDQNFFTKLRELWIDMADQKDVEQTDLEEMREEILPEKYSKEFEQEVIDLSDDSELSRIVGNSFGNARYSAIRQYILDVLSDQPLVLSDGTEAIVDRGDARHISSGALTKKTAEISEIKRLVETARLVADESATHSKFNYFKYYEALVRYRGDTFPVYLNVGREKNTGVYHLYDLTQKLRDTAHRINDVERARGLRSGNGISSENNIADSGKNINYSRSFDSAGNELSPQQAEYFANSKVRDEDGDLLIVYHGTNAEFYTFSRDYADPEGNMGSGYYFTNDPNDVEANYANKYGPDVTGKIERHYEMMRDDPQYEDVSDDELYDRAEKDFIKTEEPITLEVYLNMENPAYIGGGRTTYLFEDVYDGLEYDEEDEDAYYEAVDERINDVLYQLEDAVDGYYNFSRNEYFGILNDAIADGGITVEELRKRINTIYPMDDEGNLVGNEVTRRIIEALGYDGIIDYTVSEKFRNMGLTPESTHYIVFDSNQAKLTTNENPTDDLDIRYSKSFETSREAAPAFYSQLARAVELYKGDKIGASSLIPYLKGRGIKDEEIKWSGIETFLEGKKSVSKEEVTQYLKDNAFNVEEIEISGYGVKGIADVLSDYGINLDDYYVDWDNSFYTEDLRDAIERKVTDGAIDDVEADPLLELVDDLDYPESLGIPKWGSYSILGNGPNYKEVLYTIPGSDYINDAMETHWDQVGVLAHARITDLGETLFIDEIQSDWHNAGQKYGYTDNYKENIEGLENARDEYRKKRNPYVDSQESFLDKIRADVRRQYEESGLFENKDYTMEFGINEVANSVREHIREDSEEGWQEYLAFAKGSPTLSGYVSELEALRAGRAEVEEARNVLEAYHDLSKKAPNAPFRNGKYVEFVLKDLLRKAAEDGKKYLAWTPGWMQEQRWSDDYAEGYRIEYDQDIPKFLRKYGKQWGAKLTTIPYEELTTEEENLYKEFEEKGKLDALRRVLGDKYKLVPAIEITDAMRESVVYEGQPMFSRSFESTPEQDVELLRQVSDVLNDIDVSKVRLTDDQVLKIAKRVKRNLKSEYSTEALAENLKRAFAYWTENKNVNFNALTQIMAEIMLPVVDEMYDYSGDSRKRLLLRNKTFIISPTTAQQLGSLNELNQSLLKYGVAFTTNENYRPADRRVVTDGKVEYVPSNRQVLRLVDNWTNNEFSGVADELSLDPSISSELEMVNAMVDFLQTEKANARRQAIPDEFRETYAYNLALKAYEEFVAESRVSLKDVHQRANYLAEKEADRIISDIRSTYINQYLNMMAEGEELIQAEKDKLRERANKAHYFDMLKREMKRFERLATRPTKNKHIDFNYVKYIGAIGSLVDLRSNRRVSAANNALLELAEEYKRLSSIGMYQNGEYDPTIENMIYETGQLINGRAIRDLSSEEIKKVYEAVRAFIHAATQLNNFIDLEEARDINDAGEQSIADIESARGTGTSRFGALGDWWITTSLNPLREIDRIIDYHNDDPFHLLMNKLVKGEIKIQQYKMEMSQIFKDMDRRQQTTDEAKERAKEYRKRYDKMNDTFVEAKLGGEVREITEAQKLALIMHARNKDNLTHILYGGVLLPDNTLYKRGNYAQAYARGEVVIPTEIELENLTKNLDDFEKWFLNRCIYYFEVYSRDLINRTSLKLEGFARAEVENYYPIRVADNYVNAKTYDIGTGAESSGESLHSGMLMARVKSKLPIYLNSITQDLLRSQNFVSRYAGLSIPLRDFNRLYHLKLDNGTEAGRPVREVIEKKWGTNATKYIDEVLKDLTNGRDVSTKVFDKAMDTIRAKSAQAVLTLNPSVSIKQAASYPTAIAELDYKSVMRALVNPEGNSFLLKRADQELIAKYTPLLWSRMAGMSTQEIAELSMDRNKNVIDKSLDKLPFLTDWIRKVDVATVGRLWYATQYWVDDHYKNVEKGSDQYYRIVADKFEDVVTKTQPNYTVMTRPDILRSKNSLVKAVMMFKTQPLQNFGILYDSTARLNAKRRQYIEAKGTAGEAAALAEYRAAGSQFARSLTSQLLQTAVFTGMTFLANTLILHRWDKYKDDELNEVTAASALEQVMWDYLDSLFGNAVIVDWAEDFASYFVRKFALGEDPQLYGISVFGIDNLNELSELVQNMADKAQKGDTDKALSYAKTFAEDIAQLFGIPAANVEKLIKSVWEYTLDFTEGREITELSGTTARNYWNRIRAAYDRGENIDDMFDEMVDNVGPEKVRNFFRTDDESGIMEWASEMYTSGTDAQKKMVEDWLDELYTGDGKDTSIKNRKRAFYDYLGMDMPLELKTNAEKTEEDFRQEFTNLSDRVSEKFNTWLQSGTVDDLPIKKGDSICSEQMAWLYQNSADKEAVKRFAVQVLGYSEKAINRTASEWLAKDLSDYR